MAGAKAVELAGRLTQQLMGPLRKNSATFESVLNKQTQAAANRSESSSTANSVPGTNDSKVTPNSKLQEATEKRLKQLANELQHLFAEQGIATDQPMVFEVDSFGDLRLSGSQPQALDIETVLFQNPDLASLARSIVEDSLRLQDNPELEASQARLIVQGNQAQVAFAKANAHQL